MRRRDEQQFGSDSFLDILANVVGILVVLIVVAGLRVSRAPQVVALDDTDDPIPVAAVESLPELPVSEPVSEPLAAPPIAPVWREPEPVIVEPSPPVEPAFRSPHIVLPTLPEIAEPPPEPLRPLPPPEVPRALQVRAESLANRIDEVQRSGATLRQLQEELLRKEAALSQRLTTVRAGASQATAKVAEDRQELLALEAELQETARQLAKLRGHVEEAEQEPSAKVLEHRVTPIGRLVEGKELHFRLSQNRVAHVPIDDLASRLSAQVQRQKTMLVQTPSFEGVIGPVDGFQMRYLIERAPLSLAEEVHSGGRIVRMNVTQWTLEPTSDLKSESVEEALRRGSQFYEALLTAGSTATLTLWVYPDSFELCSAIKEFAYRHGYDIAARPLPAGVPITGSPQGSKSIAQ